MLPIPAFVSIVLGYLALRSLLSGGRPLLVMLLAACAGQSLLVALVGGYALEGLRPALPVSATLIPPLAWITFRDALVRRATLRDALPHAAAPAFTLICRLFAPQTLDLVVPLVFLAYGGAILWQLYRVSEAPLARLEAGGMPVLIWKALGWALIASAIGDGLIALALRAGHAGWAGWLITLSSSLALLFVGLLSISPEATGPDDEARESAEPELSNAEIAENAGILARLDGLLRREEAHLDPNLTLARLARRLHLPEKRLSAAVNRATGENVSRHVNLWRIRHACKLIEGGASVTEAMLASGFNTKSNFNREFRRVTGAAPSQWATVAHGSATEPAIADPDRSFRAR